LGLSGAAISGRSSAQTLFLLHYPLCWKGVHIQIYSSIQTLTNWGAVILIVRILHIFTQDYGILVIGSFSAASSMFLFAFSKKDWLVYLCKLSYYSEYPLPLLVNMFYLWCRLMIWRLSMFFLLAMSFTYDIYSHDSWIKIIVGYQRLITLQCLPLVINETILSYKNHLSGFVP
jgi:hypothetical protein